MDLDKIIEALFICSQEASCKGCPYEGKEGCAATMKSNAIGAIKELRAKAESVAAKTGANAEGIEELQGEIDAQAQAIETLQAINARLEGKVEAYEYALRLAIE